MAIIAVKCVAINLNKSLIYLSFIQALFSPFT